MNRVILFGHLGADPELKMTNGGTAVLKLRLATNEQVKRNNEWQTHTEWHNVVVWGKRAESLSRIVSKGTPLLVEGNLRTTSWEGDDGVKKYRTEINANDVKLTAKKEGGGNGGGGQRSSGGSQRQAPASSGGDYDGPSGGDDDIPF